MLRTVRKRTADRSSLSPDGVRSAKAPRRGQGEHRGRVEATGGLASSSHRGRVRQEAASPVQEDRRLVAEPLHTARKIWRATRGGVGVESWLEEKGLSKYAKEIIEATDAETLDDMALLDIDLAEEVIAQAGLKLATAKKFRDALEELRG